MPFQVWRRSGGGQGTTGCYDLVNSNLFQMLVGDDILKLWYLWQWRIRSRYVLGMLLDSLLSVQIDRTMVRSFRILMR